MCDNGERNTEEDSSPGEPASKQPKLDEEENERSEPIDQIEFVTMVDVLAEEQQLEEDCTAVLGASDEKNCTYERGYVERQALYACMTCCPESRTEAERRAGVCLACSYHCHEGHDLVELYTKRCFRCDCGNDKFGGRVRCNLSPDKEPLNKDNSYNHNFSGVYCTCRRPYPDPEDPVVDEMLQCVVCEDWLHARHLGGSPEAKNTPFAEMTCGECVRLHPFLLDYAKSGEKVDVSDIAGEQGDECVRPAALDASSVEWPPALWWDEDWRTRLCSCVACNAMYVDQRVQFLADLEDTVHAYELRGREGAAPSYERGLRALSAMERTRQLDAISHYNHMKDELKDYLQTFAQAGRIVTEEDIRDFFSRISANRPNHDIPYTCR